MNQRARSVGEWARAHPEAGLFPAALLALAGAGFSFTMDVWLLTGLLLVIGAVIGWSYARWPGQQSGANLHARVAVQVTALAALAYATGWGAALSLVFVFAIADNVRYSGAPAARVALDWSLVAIAGGQLGIQLGFVPSFIPPPAVHGVAALGAVMLLILAHRIHLLSSSKERAEADVHSSVERFQSLVRHSSDVVLMISGTGEVTYVSPSVRNVLGYDDHQLIGRGYSDLIHPADIDRVAVSATTMLENPDESVLIECRFRHSEGHWVTVESNCQNLLDAPDVAGFVINSRDITDRKSLEAALQHRAFHDGLTGLANRHLFRDRVDHVVKRGQRHADPFAVLFLDLDGFKAVNDTLGHQAGDGLLKLVADRLREATRDHDTIARLGGDEFAVLLEDMVDTSDAARVAERILRELRRPVSIDGATMHIDASIGIAINEVTGRAVGDAYLRNESDALLRNADIAMYMAKGAGKGRYEIFEPSMHVAVVERLHLESDLQRAIERSELELHYQPIVVLETSEIVGVEALLRWVHPERGMVSPADFIPLAEETGLIVPIGTWVVVEACKQLARWHRQFPDQPPLKISVNVSPRQLTHGDVPGDVRTALAVSGLDPEFLTLEITESALVSDTKRSMEIFEELKDLGIRLAVDDFGTGYSSLSYLQNFPFDILKIDRSFIDGLTAGTQNPAVVQAIVNLGRSLELETVAEGIEHNEQLTRFRELHCNFGQGYLFARPAKGADLEGLLATRTRIDASSLEHAIESKAAATAH